MTNKKTTKNKIIFLIIAGFTFLTLFGALRTSKSWPKFNNLGKVYAEDDGDDDEHERDYDEDDTIYESQSVSQNVTNVPAVDSQAIVRYIQVVDPGFDRDTDGDGLVDAIDPNPTIPEKEFFTDDDNDGVPNAADVKKGDDDFLYIEFEDTNQNGILDSLEPK